MKIFWLFRSNIKHLEYYHQYENLEEFEKNCHDFYMLMPIWLLRNNEFDTVVVWRLSKNPIKEINFSVGDKMYSQRWVRNFSEVFNYPKAAMSLFRGGFQEYDKVTKAKPDHFGKKLYLGTGKRIYSQWGGKYDVYLQEDKQDFHPEKMCLPFYKTAAPNIFFPHNSRDVDLNDICWPCNFAQLRHKGQEDFIRMVSQSKFLRSLKIIHCGNKAGVGKKICEKYKVTNIKFYGEVDRKTLNDLLNHSKFGLCMSNRVDGCPRVVTEILMSGTPLILRNQTRLLDYYKKNGVVEVNDNNLEERVKWALSEYDNFKRQTQYAIDHLISFDKVCQKNISRWKTL